MSQSNTQSDTKFDYTDNNITLFIPFLKCCTFKIDRKAYLKANFYLNFLKFHNYGFSLRDSSS